MLQVSQIVSDKIMDNAVTPGFATGAITADKIKHLVTINGQVLKLEGVTVHDILNDLFKLSQTPGTNPRESLSDYLKRKYT